MASPFQPIFWVEDILDHLQTVIATYWNTVRSSKLAAWQASSRPLILPLQASANNVEWGPNMAPAYMPSIQIEWDQGIRDTQRMMGKGIYQAWDIAITIIFRHPVKPQDASVYASRYSNVLVETIRRYYNYDSSGKVMNALLRQVVPVAIVRDSPNRIEEVAVESNWTVWAAHYDTSGNSPLPLAP